ncbi:metallophosphoesterase family protein [Palleronia sp. KMU-117]|uniref:metallophosphoesterase family protein n=1 Tax=Palleronia sp. KMU-117 TaxID=3434108 RepID=UPI003D73DCB5
MKFAAIADIHGNSAALRAVLEDIDRQRIDRVVNLGDSLSGPLDPAGTADLLIDRGFPTVAGNHDRALIDRPLAAMGLWERWTHPHLSERHLAWIAALPATLRWEETFLCHATPTDDETNWLDVRSPKGRMEMADRDHVAALLGDVAEGLILCAHTHVPRMVRIGDQTILNPGSVGCPAYLDDREVDPFIAETGAGDARYAVVERVGDTWRTSLRTVPYDPSEMAERARANNAESWVLAMTSGWFTGDAVSRPG